jgi:formylglycine-generating enzyme required for sulfatase activity
MEYNREQIKMKKIFFNLLTITAILAFVCIFTSCKKSVTEVKLDITEATILPDSLLKLTVTVLPEKAANKQVSWISSNSEVASVSDGYVKAKKQGTVTITVSSLDGNKTATCEVTVLYPGEPLMIKVDGGAFWMGCTDEQGTDCANEESPKHKVTLSSFKISQYTITQKQWEIIMGTTIEDLQNKVVPTPSLKGKGDDYPMYYVNYDDAMEFISKLNAATGKNYRLPTEAEWEYAARGGNKTNTYKYSGGSTLNVIAWYKDNASGNTHFVGIKSPNELEIYDMSGNVYEWCSDWYGSYSAEAQNNPQGPSKPTNPKRVIRGGSWNNIEINCRVAHRANYPEEFRGSNIGFRVVLP